MENSQPKTTIQLSLNVLEFNEQNYQVVLFQKLSGETEWKQLESSQFIKKKKDLIQFEIPFIFELVQSLRLEFHNEKEISKKSLCGVTHFTLGNLIKKMKEKYTANITDPKNIEEKFGSLEIKVKENKINNLLLSMKWSATKIKKDWLNKPNSYLVFLKQTEGKKKKKKVYTKIYTTEIIPKTQDPSWKSFEILSFLLCECDHKKEILIECYDEKKNGKEVLIGVVETNLEEILNPKKNEFKLLDPNKKKRKKNQNYGILKLEEIKSSPKASMLDHLSEDINLSVVLGIDFTASNGQPNFPNSLHYRNPPNLNQYEQTIVSLCSIFSQYSDNNKIPAFGFGAKINTSSSNIASDCFPLNGNTADPECDGINGVLDSYARALEFVGLHGPTNFSTLISGAVSMSKVTKNSEYTILIIITDGELVDLLPTRTALMSASKLPLSIIIVGVGDQEDFTKLEYLSSKEFINEAKLNKNVVTIVNFNETFEKGEHEFTKMSLRNFQEQFVSYYKSKQPNRKNDEKENDEKENDEEIEKEKDLEIENENENEIEKEKGKGKGKGKEKKSKTKEKDEKDEKEKKEGKEQMNKKEKETEKTKSKSNKKEKEREKEKEKKSKTKEKDGKEEKEKKSKRREKDEKKEKEKEKEKKSKTKEKDGKEEKENKPKKNENKSKSTEKKRKKEKEKEKEKDEKEKKTKSKEKEKKPKSTSDSSSD
ncbi:copine-8 [Anaeramoeba flamelloides]|uniref:Copine-8 n=1 Tax=Anaeramoeba flamelloides TaxID=1746091 RepID=A0ABQ8YYZ9_9EUKA|nr:copine-8 [Anaeramoeba flamelloides]